MFGLFLGGLGLVRILGLCVDLIIIGRRARVRAISGLSIAHVDLSMRGRVTWVLVRNRRLPERRKRRTGHSAGGSNAAARPSSRHYDRGTW